MSDDERYEILKDKDITISAKTDQTKLESVMSKLDITDNNLDLSRYGDKKRLFKKLGEEFGVFRQYLPKYSEREKSLFGIEVSSLEYT